MQRHEILAIFSTDLGSALIDFHGRRLQDVDIKNLPDYLVEITFHLV